MKKKKDSCTEKRSTTKLKCPIRAMRVLGYTWAGVRSTDLESTVRFFAETLGLSLIEQHEGLAQFVMPSGQLFEVFGSKSRYYQLHACPVLGFQVDDVRAARQELESGGVEFLTDVFGDESEAWTYFRGPDSYIYELWQTPRPLKGLPPDAPKGNASKPGRTKVAPL